MRREVTMVMWQSLIGLALKAGNDQPFRPARRRAVHAFLLMRRGREAEEEEEEEEEEERCDSCGQKPASEAR